MEYSLDENTLQTVPILLYVLKKTHITLPAFPQKNVRLMDDNIYHTMIKSYNANPSHALSYWKDGNKYSFSLYQTNPITA